MNKRSSCCAPHCWSEYGTQCGRCPLPLPGMGFASWTPLEFVPGSSTDLGEAIQLEIDMIARSIEVIE